jgi:hypothetical protein
VLVRRPVTSDVRQPERTLLYDRLIVRAADMIARGEHESALNHYCAVVSELKDRFLGDGPTSFSDGAGI